MRYFAIAIILIQLGSMQQHLCAQLSEGGLPLSFLFKSSEQKQISYKHMPRVDLAALRAEDKFNDEIKDHPWRFGENLYVDLNFDNSGTWYIPGDGSKIWRLGISSKGALTLNLAFNKYKLPDGAKLFIYSADKSQILGAFTSQNNQQDGFFASSLIRGDSIIIEYNEPAMVEFPAELSLWRITHGYRGVKDFSKSFGSSGPCNINVACPEGESVRDEIRSVALLVSGGNGFCTGALINNVNSDGTPYFLSANHCYEQPGTLLFWFNWESETCDDPPESPEASTLSGAVDRARWQDSDFWLMELNQIPPKEFGVFYSGWNRSVPFTIPGQIYGVHHPTGDIKKICLSDKGVTTSALGDLPGSGEHFWRVESWTVGTTEAGSSGSPLFDANGRIIGQLFGGEAACGNEESDWYGRFGISWTGGGTNATRLSNWLDPDNSGLLIVDGFDPEVGQYPVDGQLSSIIEPFENYTDTGKILPKILIRNAGSLELTNAAIKFWIDSVLFDSTSWSGNLAMGEKELVELPELMLDYGNYNILAKIEVANDENPANDSLFRIVTILECGNDSFPYNEGFDRDKALLCWQIVTVVPETGKIDRVTTGDKPFCEPTNGSHMIQFNSYFSTSGSEVRLQSKPFSTLIQDSIIISFDWHHDQGYTVRDDRVILQYSLNGSSWIDVQEVMRYNDTLTGWDRKEILMPDTISDKPEVYFGFLFHSEYGNNCHMDSIMITSTPIEEPYPEFFAEPRLGVIDSIIVFTDQSLNDPSVWEWDFGEGAIPASDTGRGPHEVMYSSTGLKTIGLLLDGQYLRLKPNYVMIESSPFLSPQNLTATVEGNDVYLEWDMAQSIFANSKINANPVPVISKATLVDFTIYRDGTVIDSVNQESYIDTSMLPGIYSYFVVANYTSPEGISDPSDTVFIEVPVTVIPVKGNAIKIYPNPSPGQIIVESETRYRLEIFNNQGKSVGEYSITPAENFIDLSNHPPGIYVLRFSNNDDLLITKVILE